MDSRGHIIVDEVKFSCSHAQYNNIVFLFMIINVSSQKSCSVTTYINK